MEWAKKFASHAPDGSLFFADVHEVTRGRLGRTWHQFPGQLLTTILLKPELLPDMQIEHALIYLHMALTVGCAQALASYNIGIKWPNDFMLSEKKVGGMRCEAGMCDGRLSYLIVGIGLNVSSIIAPEHPAYDYATSLSMVYGEGTDYEQLQEQIFVYMSTWYEWWKAGAYENIFVHWQSLQCCIGKRLQIRYRSAKSIEGIMIDVTSSGALRLKTLDGPIISVQHYDVETIEVRSEER